MGDTRMAHATEQGHRLPGEARRSAPVGRAPTTAGFFSSASRMSLPLGPALDPDAVRGYPIDLRVKAQSLQWPPPDAQSLFEHHVEGAQYGLGCFERWLAGDGEVWLHLAQLMSRRLVEVQQPDGSWLYPRPFPHTFPMRAPWCCGMAQGEAASLLVRVYQVTGDEPLADAARRGVSRLSRPLAEGGVCAPMNGAWWPEEFPTDPPSYVLNGAIFALFGLRDVSVALGDGDAGKAFEAGVDLLASSLERYDTGFWSLYCLRRYPLPHIASSFYHALHITQLKAIEMLAPRPQFPAVAQRWTEYGESAANRRRALAQKIAFRLVVPRNRWLAFRLPWTRL